MKFEEFRKHLHDNNIYLNSIQSYIELYDIVYYKSSRTTNEFIVAELNNLELHYYPKSGLDVLRGISQNGGNEVIISNEKFVNNYYKKVISVNNDGLNGILVDLTKNKSLREVHHYPELYKILNHYQSLSSEYFDKRKSHIKFSNYMKNYKFPFKLYENKKKVFDKVYNLKDGLSKNDLFEITHQVNGLIEITIKEHHKDKLKEFLYIN